METMRTLYQKLDLDGFDTFKPELRTYVDTLAGYRKNQFTAPEPATREIIAHEWKRSFDKWDYPT